MKEFEKLDIAIYILLFLSIVCIVSVGVLQNSINKEILQLVREDSQAVTSSQNNEYVQEVVNDTQPYSEQPVTDFAEITEIQTIFTTEEITNEQTYENVTFENSTVAYTTAAVQTTTAKNPIAWWQPNTTAVQTVQPTTEKAPELDTVFVYSKNSNKLHSRSCPYALKIKPENLKSVEAPEVQELLDKGYTFCSHCQGYVMEG